MSSIKGIISVQTLKEIIQEELQCTEDQLDFKNVCCIDLEFKELLKITCLWPLTNLTELNLSNNHIKRIENLNSLVNLKKLNLSFNKIKKIENLENLINLVHLSLYYNDIKMLENLENLNNLKIFSIGHNRVSDQAIYTYFRKFDNLRSLSIEENPCCDANMEEMIIAFTQQLVFLNYKKITLQQKYVAGTKHRLEIARLKKFDKMESENQKKRMLESTKKYNFNIDISGDQFHDKLFSNYSIMLKLNELGEDFLYMNNNLKKKIINLFLSLDVILEKYHNCVKNILRRYIEDIRELDESSVILKRNMFRQSSKEISEIKNTNPENIADLLFNLRIKLLAEECDMHSRSEKHLEKLANNMETKIEEFILQVGETYENIIQEVDNYIMLMSKSIQKKLYSNAMKNLLEDDEMQLFSDSNAMERFSNNFRSHNLAIVDNMREDITKQMRNWTVFPEFQNLEEKKMLRHRKAIAEIIECLEILKNGEKITVA